MTILIEGMLPNSNISPVEIGIGGGDILPWSGTLPSAIAAEDAAALSLQFTGSESEDGCGAFQVGLDGIVQVGRTYRVWVKAREVGAGASFNIHPPPVGLVSEKGYIHASNQVLWGPNALKNLTSSYQYFAVVMHVILGTEGDNTPNSFGMWSFILEPVGTPSKRLDIDLVEVEDISGA